MKTNRAAAEAEVLKWVGKIAPGGGMVEKYQATFAAMSDKEFDTYMHKLADGTATITIESPNFAKAKITTENNLKVGKEMGHEFFQHLWLTDPATGLQYKTPLKYLIIDLPLRRQQQMLVEKSSIPENNRHVDELTGQPSGDSHSSSLTLPELQVLYARGGDAVIEELAKFRGGDLKAFQRMTQIAQTTGRVSMAQVKLLGPTRVKSTESLSTLMTCMHLSNNL